MSRFDDYDPYDLEKSINAYKWTMMIFNVFSTILGIVTFSVCIWVRFDLDFWEWVVEIDWYTYWYCTYFLMITTILIVINSLIGAYGIIYERPGLILFNSISMSVLFFFELIGGVIIIVYGVEESTVLVAELNERFMRLVYLWDVDPRASRILRQIMEYIGCCGADGSDDFINAMKPVPYECRDLITGNEYGFGCQQQLAWWLESWSAFFAATMALYMIMTIFGTWSNHQLRAALTAESGKY